MDREQQAKVNNANRKRGSRFEKKCADFLDMDVVPYSGSNSRFGYGDVRDSVWLGECKNITPDGNVVVIQRAWLDDNIRKARAVERKPFLAWTAYGKSEKYVILDHVTFLHFSGHILESIHCIFIDTKSVNNHNIHINTGAWWVKGLKPDTGISRIEFDKQIWFMMRIEHFKHLIEISGLKGQRTQI